MIMWLIEYIKTFFFFFDFFVQVENISLTPETINNQLQDISLKRHNEDTELNNQMNQAYNGTLREKISIFSCFTPVLLCFLLGSSPPINHAIVLLLSTPLGFIFAWNQKFWFLESCGYFKLLNKKRVIRLNEDNAFLRQLSDIVYQQRIESNKSFLNKTIDYIVSHSDIYNWLHKQFIWNLFQEFIQWISSVSLILDCGEFIKNTSFWQFLSIKRVHPFFDMLASINDVFFICFVLIVFSFIVYFFWCVLSAIYFRIKHYYINTAYYANWIIAKKQLKILFKELRNELNL